MKIILRKSNLNIIEKCAGEDDEMILAMMDDRENQNPNQLKKSQSIQADELKKLSLNKTENSSSKNATSLSNDSTNKVATKHSASGDTNIISKASSEVIGQKGLF